MTKVDLGYGLSIDLENGEEIIFKCINDPNDLGWRKAGDSTVMFISGIYDKADTLGQTLLSRFTFGFAGPKLIFNTQLVITNKRMVMIPFPNSKRTKTENYTTRTLYFGKDIKGARATRIDNDKMYAECINAWFEITPVKGVDLKGLYFMLRLNLTQEETIAVSKSMQQQAANQKKIKRVEELASQIEHDGFFDAFTTQARVESWKSNVKKMNKISVLGDKSILPIRDYLVWLINDAAGNVK
jgi:hypothetical protein